jgi:hypothetical protein
VSTAKILAKYKNFHWTYCLGCKKPMYGEERPCEQPEGSSWTCGHCGAVNLFRNSIQPVELKRSHAHSFSSSTRIGNIEENIPGPEAPSSNPVLSGT